MHGWPIIYATLFAAAALPVSMAYADVTISSDPTANMDCSAGVCAPTATDAVLNVADLENLLASGNVSIVTTNGGVQAKNIDVVAPFSWSAAHSLNLDAHQSLTFAAVVQNSGTGSVALVTNDGGRGGTLNFAIDAGRLDTKRLSIDGIEYITAGSFRQLVREINNNPHVHVALSANVNASRDGIYDNSPIQSLYSDGVLNGLGHKIGKLKIVQAGRHGYVGLLRENGGHIASLVISDADVAAKSEAAAILAGVNNGKISNCSTRGTVTTGKMTASGLVADNGNGTIIASQSSATLQSSRAGGGGLVGTNEGRISQSFATGDILGKGYNGGLVAVNTGVIENSYARGGVTGTKHCKQAALGGFTGYNGFGAVIATSYSIGMLVDDRQEEIGGFTGVDKGAISNSYWDTETSGTDQGSSDGNDKGLTGLTTEQFQSGLPAGFDPSIWAEDPNINQGLPYLINNPPG